MIRKTTSGGRALVCAAAAAQSLLCSQAFAADDADIRELRALIARQQQQLDALLAAQNTQKEKAAATSKVAEAPTASNPLPVGLKLYGSLDSGVEYVSKVGANATGMTRIPSTSGSGPSTLGLDFRGRIHDGIAAIGKAEMGLYLDTGSSGQGSRLFGRQLFVGVDSAWGALTFGRQYSMLYWGLMAGDLLGPNIYGLGSIDAYVPNARADNAIVWRARFDKLSLGLGYSFGRETVSGSVPASGVCAGEDSTDAGRCRSWSAMLKYEETFYGISAAYDKQHGGTSAQASFYGGAPAIAMTSSSDRDSRATVNAFLRLGKVRIGTGWLGRKVQITASEVSQNTEWLQAEYTILPQWSADAGFFHVSNPDQDRRANLYALRTTYRFDEQLSTYVTAGYIDNGESSAYGVSGGGSGTSPVAGNAQLGTMIGVRYRF
ncbi:porin [Niveibacterium terrae]|uniref:porin n=1 Tax=Niveibacterium terrae TaxID=3373598 RepID=UPI003A9261B4